MGNRRLKEICDDIWIFLLRIRFKCWYFLVGNQGKILLLFINLLLYILKLIAWAAVVFGLMSILGHFCEVDIYSDRKSFINRSRVRSIISFMRMLAQNHQT
ncbi:hypothetical protein, partial [Microcoleus asticus]